MYLSHYLKIIKIGGIANNKINDYYRSRYRHSKYNNSIYFKKNNKEYNYCDYVGDVFNLENYVITQLELTNILRDIADIDEIGLKIFLLYFCYGKSIKEIAILLRLSESNVKIKLHRLLKKVRKKQENQNLVSIPK